jgi:hypothetical protein
MPGAAGRGEATQAGGGGGALAAAQELLRELARTEERVARAGLQGDPLVRESLEQARRALGCAVRVRLPAGGREEARCALANALLRRPLLRPRPRFDVLLEHASEASAPLSFRRVAFSGWHVVIDEAAFEALAYGDGAEQSAPESDAEAGIAGATHYLCIRGGALLSCELPERCAVLYCCTDPAVAAGRHSKQARVVLERERRASDFTTPSGSPGSSLAEWSVDSTLECMRRRCDLRDLELVLADSTAAADGASHVSQEQELLPHVECNTVTCTRVALPADCAAEAAAVAAGGLARKVANKNVARIRESLASNARRAHTQDKLAYWSDLRKPGSGAAQGLVVRIFDACLRGSDDLMFESAIALANAYRRSYGSEEAAATRLVQWQASASLSTGFLSGFGGLAAMAVTVPAGVLATWITAARLAFATAHLYGHDVWSPSVCTSVMHALTGGDAAPTPSTAGGPVDDLVARLCECAVARMGRSSADSASCGARFATDDGSQGETELLPKQGSPQSQGSPPKSPPPPPPEQHQHQHEHEHQQKRQKEQTQHQLPEAFDPNAYASLYELLEVAETATPFEVRRAYRQQALRCHPDKLAAGASAKAAQAAKERFQTLSAAYAVLDDPVSRAEYDRQCRAGEWRWAMLKEKLAGGLASAKGAFRHCSEELERSSVQVHVATRALTSLTGAVAQSVVAAELRSSLVAGEKLVAQATTRTTSKAIPLLGAILGAALDCATTAKVGLMAKRLFADAAHAANAQLENTIQTTRS